jgi:hypothetical protein
MINNPIKEYITITFCIATQMIYTTKIRIPELADYWPEMPNLDIEY